MSSPPRPALFIRWFLIATALAMLAVGLFVLLLDPYGVSPIRLPIKRPIMDINQRFMYPQIVRSHQFDSAVFGSSTLRLLDPKQLDQAFGGRFANLAMNAATPWEQSRLIDLFLRETPAPKTIIFGVDPQWCSADADQNRLTFRAFPDSFYDDNRWNDFGHLLNLKTIEITLRLAAFHLGRVKERIRGDGYEVFVGDDARYDVERARTLIWQGNPPPAVRPVEPAVRLGEAEIAAIASPALVWLQQSLARLPRQTKAILIFPPVHVAGLPVPGSHGAAVEALCKARVTALARAAGATVVDMRLDTPLTRDDHHYWDRLHYRIDQAPRLIDAMRKAVDGSMNGELFTVPQ